MSSVYLFPGQGSQSPGMMAGFSPEQAVVRQTFDEASQIIDRDLWSLVSEGPAEDLNQTVVTQPVMLSAGIATWRLLQDCGVPKPEYLAGHSLGEYTALVAAGALAFADAVRLVEFRARVMQEAVAAGTGAMAAVLGLDDADVVAVCARAAEGDIVEAANFNAPGQVVIAGAKAAVERACALAREAGARRCLELPVSVPSHCRLMEPASRRLAEYLEDIEVSPPKIPVVHNAHVSCSNDAKQIKTALVNQLFMPVRWVETIEWLRENDVSRFVECGPGKVLAGLNRRIDRSLETLAIIDEKTVTELSDETREKP